MLGMSHLPNHGHMTPAERAAKFKAAHPERAAIYNRRYYERHPERVRAAIDAWRTGNPDKVKAQQRAYRTAHLEESRAKGRRWYAAHPEYYANRRPAYAAANRERLRVIEGRRRTKVNANGTFTITDHDWRGLLHRYHDSCAYCGIRGPLEFDHVIPISRGGRHSIGNLVPACRYCNGSKSNKLLMEWRSTRSAGYPRLGRGLLAEPLGSGPVPEATSCGVAASPVVVGALAFPPSDGTTA